MKTDAEVLQGAIEILEKEGAWCQGQYFTENGEGNGLSYCAEGAIRSAAGLKWARVEINGDAVGNYYPHGSLEAMEQVLRIDDLVLTQLDADETQSRLAIVNDDPKTTAEDMILGMKKALGELI